MYVLCLLFSCGSSEIIKADIKPLVDFAVNFEVFITDLLRRQAFSNSLERKKKTKYMQKCWKNLYMQSDTRHIVDVLWLPNVSLKMKVPLSPLQFHIHQYRKYKDNYSSVVDNI